MPSSPDPRLTNQAAYLTGVELRRQAWTGRDHDHCAFCWAKFMSHADVEALREGCCTLDEDHWICTACFEDFHAQFGWRVVGGRGE